MGNNDKWASATLRIHSKSMSVAQISKALETVASDSYEKGTSVSPRNPNSPVREEFTWILHSGLDSSQPLEAHIGRLIEYIEQKVSVLEDLLSNCEIDLFCGFSSGNGQGGIVLDADLLRRLTAIPLVFVLDLYPPSNMEVDVGESSDSAEP